MKEIRKIEEENWKNVLGKTIGNFRNINVDNYTKHLSLSPCGDKIILVPDVEGSIYDDIILGTISISIYRDGDPTLFGFGGDIGKIYCRTLNDLLSTKFVYESILNKFKEFKMLPYKKIIDVQDTYYKPYHEIYFYNEIRYDVDITIDFKYGKYEIVVNYDMCKFIVKDIDLSKAINDMIDKVERFINSINVVLNLQGLK